MNLKIGAILGNIAVNMGKEILKPQNKTQVDKKQNEEEENNIVLEESDDTSITDKIKNGAKNIIGDIKNTASSCINPIVNMIKNGVSEVDIVNSLLKAKDTTEETLDFIESFLSDISLTSVNKSLKGVHKKEIKDSDISNTKEFNGITNQDMLLLSNMAYTDIATIENKGKSLGNIVDEIKSELKSSNKEGLIDENGNITKDGMDELIKNGFSTGIYDNEAYAKMLNEISNSEELSSLVILDNTDQVENYITATTYGHLDENGKLKENPTVIFKGTGNSTGWADNAASLIESDTQMQKAALEYIERQQYSLNEYKKDGADSIDLTVGGHSKGGNMAMYAAIKNENVSNCLSFDGQGFNREFIELYGDEINENKDKITAVNSYIDPVSSLLNEVAGKTFYVDCAVTKSNTDNKGNPILEDISGFKDLAWDAHSLSTVYKAICDDDTWTVCDKSGFSDTIKEISEATESFSDEKKQYLATLIADAFVKYLGKGEVRENDAKKLSKPYEISGYDLTIVKTERGYNLYCTSKNSGNTVATLTPEGKLESGILDPFSNGDNDGLLNAINQTIQAIG